MKTKIRQLLTHNPVTNTSPPTSSSGLTHPAYCLSFSPGTPTDKWPWPLMQQRKKPGTNNKSLPPRSRGSLHKIKVEELELRMKTTKCCGTAFAHASRLRVEPFTMESRQSPRGQLETGTEAPEVKPVIAETGREETVRRKHHKDETNVATINTGALTASDVKVEPLTCVLLLGRIFCMFNTDVQFSDFAINSTLQKQNILWSAQWRFDCHSSERAHRPVPASLPPGVWSTTKPVRL